jgi:hypothetical protein
MSLFLVAPASTSAATGTENIHLTNASNWQEDDLSSSPCFYAAGDTIGTSTVGGCAWNVANAGTVNSNGPFTCCSFNSTYSGDQVYSFANSGTCIGEIDATVELTNNTGCLWVRDDGHLINVLRTDHLQTVVVLTAKTNSHGNLYTAPSYLNTIQSGLWQKWTIS